ADGQSLGETDSILAETNGTVWFASAARGVFRWDGTGMHLAPAARGVDTTWSAYRIYQDSEGQIWFATQGGLVRWDRASTNLVAEGGGSAAFGLYRDAHGVWWLGTDNGLERRAPGSTVNFSKPQGLPGNRVRDVASAGAGNLWVATDNGLAYFEEEGLQVLSMKDGLPNNVVSRVAIAADGSVWFTCPPED